MYNETVAAAGLPPQRSALLGQLLRLSARSSSRTLSAHFLFAS
jgi:hypothetical protein